MALFAKSNQKAIAAVTHKGYLRELERGLFGMESVSLAFNPILMQSDFLVCRVVTSIKLSTDTIS
jgi:hypothetical protein